MTDSPEQLPPVPPQRKQLALSIATGISLITMWAMVFVVSQTDLPDRLARFDCTVAEGVEEFAPEERLACSAQYIVPDDGLPQLIPDRIDATADGEDDERAPLLVEIPAPDPGEQGPGPAPIELVDDRNGNGRADAGDELRVRFDVVNQLGRPARGISIKDADPAVGGPTAEIVLAWLVAIAGSAAAFTVAARMTRHPTPGPAVVSATLVGVIIAGITVFLLRDRIITPLVTLLAWGAVVVVRLEEVHDMRTRRWAAALAVMTTVLLVVVILQLAIMVGPLLPFFAVYFADRRAENRAAT